MLKIKISLYTWLILLGTLTSLNAVIIAEYRFDECFLLGSAYDDVRDNSVNIFDATSNDVQIDANNRQINHSALFNGTSSEIYDDNPFLLFNDAMTISFWVYPTDDSGSKFLISKRENGTNGLGWLIKYQNGSPGVVRFRVKLNNGTWYNTDVTIPEDWLGNWHHVVAMYDGTDFTLYVNDAFTKTNAPGTMTNAPDELLFIGKRLNNAQWFKGNIDEVKLFDTALTDQERTTLYNNELAGKNYDGTTREPVVCSASTGEKDWQLIGIPAEARTTYETITFDDVFSSVGTAGEDYFAYKPVYDTGENTTTYAEVSGTENIEFGTAYWLTTKVATTWDVESLVNVDYDISKDVEDACTDNRCVEIDIVPAVSDGDGSSGPNNYTMFGFVGKSPVDWADCRIVINGTDIYTPEEADDLGYISREIWYWTSGLGEGSDGSVRGSDYASCTDALVSGCQLVPFQGYWIQTRPDSIGHTVQILLPKGDDQ